MDTEQLIEFFTKCIERADEWIEDAKVRDDWNDVYYYMGQRHLANETIVRLGGKAVG